MNPSIANTLGIQGNIRQAYADLQATPANMKNALAPPPTSKLESVFEEVLSELGMLERELNVFEQKLEPYLGPPCDLAPDKAPARMAYGSSALVRISSLGDRVSDIRRHVGALNARVEA